MGRCAPLPAAWKEEEEESKAEIIWALKMKPSPSFTPSSEGQACRLKGCISWATLPVFVQQGRQMPAKKTAIAAAEQIQEVAHTQHIPSVTSFVQGQTNFAPRRQFSDHFLWWINALDRPVYFGSALSLPSSWNKGFENPPTRRL